VVSCPSSVVLDSSVVLSTGAFNRRRTERLTTDHGQRTKKFPRQTTRDFTPELEVCLKRMRSAELFSGLFYVAASRLNSPRFSEAAYTPRAAALSSNRAVCNAGPAALKVSSS
jgi:hypothetical protein